MANAVEDLPSGIEAMKHNPFDLEPVKGAKAYYLSTFLHDWPDKQARRILSNIRGAMNEDSVLLILKNFLPESTVSLYSGLNNIPMMAIFSALDRAQRELLDSIGFAVVKAWAPDVMVAGQSAQAHLNSSQSHSGM